MFVMLVLKAKTVLTEAFTALSALSCALMVWRDLVFLLRDLPRHNSFRYINAGTIPASFFDAAGETLGDPYIYIVLSDTKTPASRVIAAFTGDSYNHVSLSFDPALTTLVSYNGGSGKNSPGLNPETVGDLSGRPGAEMAVFKLFAGTGKKSRILDRIKQINNEGSSYNRLGLVIKRSLKPNIMFCSQFVYSMLEHVGLDYLEKESVRVKPADFISKIFCLPLSVPKEPSWNQS
jgi:hypothetical protein